MLRHILNLLSLSPAAHPPAPAEQQQAPGKPFLRIISSGEPLGLAFPSDADKEEVLDLMKQLKPAGAPNGGAGAAASATGIPTPAEQRRILAADKDLEALYGQLVRSGILSDADFWRARQKELAKVSGRDGARGSGAQRAGLSSVMHEVERLHDGQTERVNIQLTPADIQRIFLERPEVHRAYMANVPHALPEKDFWQQYFKLEYKKAARR